MWAEVYEKHYPELERYAMAACHDSAAAEDLAQETFLKALQNADTFEDLGPSQRRAWLFRTLKNGIVDRFRRAALEARYQEQLEEASTEEEPGYAETETAMVLALLSGEDRELFRMRYLEGYNASELSEIFHLPPGTIRARLSRGRKLLKDSLAENYRNTLIP